MSEQATFQQDMYKIDSWLTELRSLGVDVKSGSEKNNHRSEEGKELGYFIRPAMATTIRQEQEIQKQNYLISELESLGLSTIRLNEFNDNIELGSLVKRLKEAFLAEWRRITRRP